MLRTPTILAVIVVVFASIGATNQASARGGSLYPLTRCGPDLAYLCHIHGYFDDAPFHYNVAIYPGCIKRIAVDTPHGVQYRRAVVCGAPARSMVWW